MEEKIDIIGIGNIMVDSLVEVDEETFARFNLKRGNLSLIDDKTSKNILNQLKEHEIKIAPGGSSANTISTSARLGASTAFIGRVGSDEYGEYYLNEFKKDNVKANVTKGIGMTGHCIAMITPDTERTMSVHLGEATNIQKEDLPEQDLKQSKILHIEGYQLEDPILKHVVYHAIDIAKANNTLISMDLGDPGVIERNLKEIKRTVELYADILFLNEDEAKVFTGLDNIDLAVEKLGLMDLLAIIKVGAKGSIIRKGQSSIKIDPIKANAVDTTGAGDNYAAGFLYGLTKGLPLKTCGDIASTLGSKIVERVGARFEEDPKELIKHLEQINQV